jgi:alpha-L-fucosidase
MIQRFGDGRDWFLEKRFGLFVHWGLYAIPAWHEQHQWRGQVERSEYGKLSAQFNPTKFDPEEWLDVMEGAGMQYICLTTKHHDGYCLWDTKQTEFKVTNSPYGKDILAMLAASCQRRNIPLCLYHSVVDWHHPNYPNQGRSHELTDSLPGDEPDMGRYTEFLRAQVRELCTDYGEIHGFWWDMNVTGIRDTSINEMIRQLQPQAVINNRGFDEGDFGTPERDYDHSIEGTRRFETRTEACQSVGRESWGYKEDEDYYSVRHLISSVDRTLAKGGNYLLNIGPMADGTLPKRGVQLLQAVGDWFKRVRDSFDGAEPASELTDNREVLLTRKENTLYVHLTQDPTCARALLDPIAVSPQRAVLLNNGAELETRVDLIPTRVMGREGILRSAEPCLRVRNLPIDELAGETLVLRLDFESLPDSA